MRFRGKENEEEKKEARYVKSISADCLRPAVGVTGRRCGRLNEVVWSHQAGRGGGGLRGFFLSSRLPANILSAVVTGANLTQTDTIYPSVRKRSFWPLLAGN